MSFIKAYSRCYLSVTNNSESHNLSGHHNAPINLVQLSDADFVDMGLPSGNLWYNSNIGTDNPIERGLYFSWGNIEGHDSIYTQGSYAGEIGEDYSFTSEEYVLTDGYEVSGSIPLSNDAANEFLLNDWRIPTDSEYLELIDNCTISDITINGVPGRLFTSNTNGNVLFFPNTGYGNGSVLSYPKFEGCYWTSVEDSENTNNALCLYLSTGGGLGLIHPEEKRFGFCIRAIKTNI